MNDKDILNLFELGYLFRGFEDEHPNGYERYRYAKQIRKVINKLSPANKQRFLELKEKEFLRIESILPE
jgi:hypothetical protein